jgi:hypothetical protein
VISAGGRRHAKLRHANIVAKVKVVNSFLLSSSLFLPGSGLAIRVEINGS